MATVNVTETPTTLDATGAAELAVTNTGGSPVFVNTQRVRSGQRVVFDTSRPLQVATQTGATSTVDTAVATPTKAVGTDPTTLVASPDGSTAGLWVPDQIPTPIAPPSRVVTRFAAGHTWTGGTDDTAVRLFTDRSYRGVTNNAGGSLYLTSPTFATSLDLSTSAVRLWVRVDDPTRVNAFQILATTGAGNTFTANVSQILQPGEWSPVTVNRAQFAVAGGTPVWTGVTKFDVRFTDKSAGALTVWLGGLDLLPDLATTYPNGVFVMEADDGIAGQLPNLVPIVSSRGIPVTYNVIAGRFQGASPQAAMTPADLRAFQDKHGWQISCHAYAQTIHDTGGPPADLEADFLREKQWLHAQGLHAGADDYALCPGTGSPVPEGPVMDALRRNFRSVRVNTGFYETAIPSDPLRLRSILFTGNSVANLQTNINAAAGAGGALIFTVHDVLAGATNGTSNGTAAIAAANLASVLDYAIGKGMAFRTRGDWLARR